MKFTIPWLVAFRQSDWLHSTSQGISLQLTHPQLGNYSCRHWGRIIVVDGQDVLILDELGYVPFSKAGAELLFDVVGRAYEQTSLIVTSNLPFEQWTEVLGSERLTGAMLDRLTHRVHILEANGESYRLRQAKARRRK